MKKDVLLFTAILVVSLITSIGFVSAKDYAGYDWYGPNQACPTNCRGVSGEVKTIRPAIGGFEFFFGWTNVQLSYANAWWLQLGYHYSGIGFGENSYFWENKTSNNPGNVHWHISTIQYPPPASDSWHKYEIDKEWNGSGCVWSYWIDGSNNVATILNPVPNIPIDLSSKYEYSHTFSPSPCINGSWVKNLKWWNYPQGFQLWTRHWPDFTWPPYWGDQTYHYEFKGFGG